MRFHVLATFAAIGAAACASGGVAPSSDAMNAPERSSLSVTVRGPMATALERTKSAFVAEGLTVADASSGGVVTSAPVTIGERMSTVTVRYRATVIDAGRDSSRVVLSGETSNAPGYGATATVRPLTSHTPSMDAAHGGHGWAKLERIAAALVAP